MGRTCGYESYGHGAIQGHHGLREVARRSGGEEVCELPYPALSFLWPRGRTMIEASEERSGSVLLRAYLVIGPDLDQEIQTEVALFSAGLALGHLELDEDGDVSFLHRVPHGFDGDYLDAEITVFCSEAERMGGILCQRLGGRSSMETVQQTVCDTLRGCPAARRLEIN